MFTKLVKNSVAVGLLTLAFGFNANAGYVVQYENSLGDAKNNEAYGNSLFLQYNTKLDDNWGFNVELLEEFLLQSNTDSSDRLRFSHVFLRTNFKRKNLFSFSGFNGALGIRYFFPTSASMQAQGSMGALTFRPEMSRSFGSFNLTTMLVAGPYLQRKRKAYVGSSGNPFWVTGFRLVPSYDINANFYVAGDFLLFNTMSFGENGEGTSSTNKIDNEIELGFKGEATSQWSIGVVAHSAGTLTGENGDRVYSPRSFDFNLRFSKEF